jgi:hypothetical protein
LKVVGKPIPIPNGKIENPTDEEISAYHQKFLEAFEKLYNDHKVANGMKDIPLRIE